MLRSAAALGAAVFVCAAAADPARGGETDRLNLFVVVESGADHVTLLDGDRLERFHRFATRASLQGEPQFSPDGRYVFFAARDGWISKFDLWNLETVAEIRAGSDTRSLAVSSDGRLLAVGSAVPAALILLDAELRPVKIIAASDAAKRRTSPVSQVRSAAARRSFVAALPGLSEIWEVSYDPAAPEIAEGLVHDYKLREGSFVSGFLHPRRSPLEAPIEDFRLLPDGRRLVGHARAADSAQVIHLDVRRRLETVDRYSLAALDEQNAALVARLQAESGMPLADVAFDRNGRYALASTPALPDALIVYDTSTLREVKRLSMPGPVRKYNVFNEIRRHSGSRHQP